MVFVGLTIVTCCVDELVVVVIMFRAGVRKGEVRLIVEMVYIMVIWIREKVEVVV